MADQEKEKDVLEGKKPVADREEKPIIRKVDPELVDTLTGSKETDKETKKGKKQD